MGSEEKDNAKRLIQPSVTKCRVWRARKKKKLKWRAKTEKRWREIRKKNERTRGGTER